MSEQSLYDVLGIKRTATVAQITAAYRRQAKLHHPDKHSAASPIERNAHEQQFMRAQAAYEALCDPEQRAYYDKHGRTRQENAATPMTAVDRTLMEAFAAVFKPLEQDVLRTDYIYQMRLLLTDQRDDVKDGIRKMESVLAKLEQMAGRFIRDDFGDDNMLGREVKKNIEGLKGQIAVANTKVDHLKACLEEIHWYRYTVDGGMERSYIPIRLPGSVVWHPAYTG